MNRKWLLLFVLVLNHTLFNSAMAAMHASADDHGLYESAHVHLSVAEQMAGLLETAHEHGDDGQSLEHDSNAHLHPPCDFCDTPLLLEHHRADTQADKLASVDNRYLNLAYCPPVPPPTR